MSQFVIISHILEIDITDDIIDYGIFLGKGDVSSSFLQRSANDFIGSSKSGNDTKKAVFLLIGFRSIDQMRIKGPTWE